MCMYTFYVYVFWISNNSRAPVSVKIPATYPYPLLQQQYTSSQFVPLPPPAPPCNCVYVLLTTCGCHHVTSMHQRHNTTTLPHRFRIGFFLSIAQRVSPRGGRGGAFLVDSCYFSSPPLPPATCARETRFYCGYSAWQLLRVCGGVGRAAVDALCMYAVERKQKEDYR